MLLRLPHAVVLTLALLAAACGPSNSGADDVGENRGMASTFRRDALVVLLCSMGSIAHAAESARSVPSPMGGNGHNVSFDGRLYIVTRGSAEGTGWHASVFRPERGRRP